SPPQKPQHRLCHPEAQEAWEACPQNISASPLLLFRCLQLLSIEIIFRCPVCGKAVQHCDNGAMVEALADKIEQLEGKKVEVDSLSSDAPRKLIPVGIDSNTGQLLVMKEKHNEKLRQVFVSHSSKDKELIDVYRSYFDDAGVKPIFMEYERWSRKGEPNWKWINRHIKESDALWVILTRNVVDLKSPQTQNWVSYEIGVTSACEPRKPVYVWMEEPINFLVPYLDHYIPYSIHLEKKDEKWWSEEYGRIFKEHYSTVTKQIITSPTTYENDTKTPKVQCNNCRTTFCYHGTDYSFSCPCCSSKIDTITQRVA
ncbi:MAG: TIR domain-containing protein, partial [Candidatus Bathyarchaeota archaeon]